MLSLFLLKMVGARADYPPAAEGVKDDAPTAGRSQRRHRRGAPGVIPFAVLCSLTPILSAVVLFLTGRGRKQKSL